MSTTPVLPEDVELRLKEVKLLGTEKVYDVWNSWKFVASKELKDFIAQELSLGRQEGHELGRKEAIDFYESKISDSRQEAFKDGFSYGLDQGYEKGRQEEKLSLLKISSGLYEKGFCSEEHHLYLKQVLEFPTVSVNHEQKSKPKKYNLSSWRSHEDDNEYEGQFMGQIKQPKGSV